MPKIGKQIPTEQDNMIFDLCYKRAQALTQIDAWRNITETIDIIKRSFKFDLTKVENGVAFPLGASSIFCYLGFFKLSKKFLDFAENIVNLNDVKEVLEFDVFDTVWKCWSGNFDQLKEYDNEIWKNNLKLGEFWAVSTHIIFHGGVKLDQGEFKESKDLIEMLADIANVYDSGTAKVWFYYENPTFLNAIGKFNDAIVEADAGIFFLKQADNELIQIHLLGHKAYSHIMLENYEEAKASLEKGDELIMKQDYPPAYATSHFYSYQFLYYTKLLERQVMTGSFINLSELRKKGNKSRKKALQAAKKHGFTYISVIMISGTYFWLINDQKKAIKCWNEAIEEGARRRQKLWVARTYMEVGKRLLEKNSKYKELNGITAEKYLEMAREMFEEMDLQWDLDELDRIVSYR